MAIPDPSRYQTPAGLLPSHRTPDTQVWGSLSFITEIRHRVVLLRLLHLTGTVAACQQAALAYHATASAGRRLPPVLAKLAEEANARLGTMAV